MKKSLEAQLLSGLQAVRDAVKSDVTLAKLLTKHGHRITPQSIWQWSYVPWNRVLVCEEISGVPRFVIRPDLYPPPSSNRAAPPGYKLVEAA